MMHKLLLNLFAIPTVASSISMALPMVGFASAVEKQKDVTSQASCAPVEAKAHLATRSPYSKNLTDATEIPVQTPDTDFTVAESDAAVTLFGCDCPSCIGALRQLRTQALLSGSEGHCWTAMQRNSPEAVQATLQMLEAEQE